MLKQNVSTINYVNFESLIIPYLILENFLTFLPKILQNHIKSLLYFSLIICFTGSFS